MGHWIIVLLIVLFGWVPSLSAEPTQPKNVIILIADGMGYHHVDAGSLYRYGESKGQPYWDMTHLAMQTFSLNNEDGYEPDKANDDFDYVNYSPTDSAAAATAMSTGHKTHSGIIQKLKDGTTLPSLMDDAESLGKSTGVLSTVYFAHATPAGFVAHNESRNNIEEIAHEMIWESQVDLIIGAGHPWFDDDGKQVGGLVPKIFDTPLEYDRVGGEASWKNLLMGKTASDADGDGEPDQWNLVTSRDEILELADAEEASRVLGVLPVYSTLQANRSGDVDAKIFEVPLNETSPTMAELMAAALNVLSKNREGFVLMGEGGAIDWASHGNHSGRMLEEQIDFDRAVERTIEWIEENSNWEETLLVVTADHETGYLTGIGSDPLILPLTNRGPGVEPGMEWHSGSHTNQLVPLFVKGAGADEFANFTVDDDPKMGSYVDNTVFAKVLRKLWNKNSN